MARPSSINRLPPQFLEALQELLRNPAVTQLEATVRINAMLADADEDARLSKSAVNRYAVRMEEVGEKLRHSREIADMWIARLGNQPAGKVGQLLNEVVRNLAFDSAMSMSEDNEPAHPKLIRELAVAIEKLEKASSENEARSQKIIEAERKRAAEKLTEMEQNSGKAKLDAETLRRVRQEVYGLAA